METKERCVVLVTGGAGFLGQHIVGLLQERADHVTQIRVLDVTPYKNKLGTKNVIEACSLNGVRRLIYCSSIEVVVGKHNVYYGTEDNTNITRDQHFDVYGSSKVEAEKLVLEANCDKLQTVSLRPSVLYGEGEFRSLGRITNTYLARKLGAYVRFDCQNGMADHVYVGNVAWGFICAEKTLLEKKYGPGVCGSSYFIVDDSPVKSVTDFMDLMLLDIGLKPIRPVLPIWLAVIPLYIMYIILLIVSYVYKANITVGIDSFTSIKRVYIFKYEKAKQCLGYQPIYCYDEAKERTVKFLSSILHGK
ncbi:hypothetical protein ACF0H5_017582 [Mactra antiquata]